MLDSSNFLPRIPQPVQSLQPVAPPLPPKSGSAAVKAERMETLFSWAIESLQAGIKNLPKMAKMLAIQLGIVLAINLIFWPLKTYTLPGPIASIVSIIIFLTATYNNVIPKTIYWVIVFTFGKKLFFKIKKEGFASALNPIKGIVPEFQKAQSALREKSYALLLLGGGLGLIIANNFASYTRFAGARNKIDKYFVALVISFAVSYILGESKKGWLFKFGRLASSDLRRLLKRQSTYTDDHTFILLSGFVAGLLLDAPIILFKLMYGGYILGGMLLIGAIGLLLFNMKQRGTR